MTFLSTHKLNSVNPKCIKTFWLLAITCIQFFVVSSLRSQIVYYYDQSGNPTNSFLSSSATLNSSASNSTPNVLLNGQLSLTATATGSGIITYQWQLNGVNITGATNATYSLVNAGTSNSGAYSVIVSNGSASQTNQLGSVTVFGTTNTLYAIAYGLGQYIAVGTSGTIVNSSNLIAWGSSTSGTTNQLNGITFGSNQFVAVGANGTVLTSTNGTAWTTQNSTNVNTLNDVTFGNGLFVAVGNGGIVLTSPNGTNWTQQTFSNPNLEGIAYRTNMFVAVGTGGAIWNSPNGTNWTGQNSPISSTLTAIAYGNGMFIAVGTDGTILSSPDSTNWTSQTSGTLQDFTSISFFNQTFYAIGPDGQNFISTNGANWGVSYAGTYTLLYGSTVGNGIPVAAGADGLVIQIPDYQLDHFAWNAISSPQRVGQAFATTITAQDGANNTVSNFNGSVTLSEATSFTSSTNNILGNVSPEYTNTGSFTLGYSFTPDANLLVTQVRHYGTAQKVCIWDEDSEQLLASINITNNPGGWASTPVPVPLTLSAGESYIVSVYTGTNTTTSYYYNEDGPSVFANGTIDQAFSTNGDSFPVTPDTAFWFFVDLGYTVQDSVTNAVSPTTVNFVNGVATPNVTVTNAGQGMTLMAADASGHTGTSAPFNVYGTNDIAVTLSASPNPAAVNSNLTYTITVMNAGPTSATGVAVTNVLPANVTFVSASSTQGTCQNAGGTVTCSVGTLANQATATITIVVTPTVAGVILTNTVNIAESGTDSNLSDNTATNLNYVPPTLSVGNAIVTESTLGVTYASVPITLSSPSVLSIYFNVSTADGANAIAGRDYVPYDGTLYIPAGSTATSYTVPIGVQGSTIISPTKEFTVQISEPVNATITNSLGAVYILNPNGVPGQLYNFAWNNISSPQTTNTPFGVTVTAKDANGNAATNFNGTAALAGINLNDATNTLLSSPSPAYSSSTAIMTVGYEFTPTNDIYVTDVRSYAGSKVSIWTDTGFLMTSQNVTSVPGTWVDTPLATPVWLQASNTYIIGAFTDGSTYYWREDGAMSFPDGLISQGWSAPGDTFPTNFDSAQWYLVDLRYVRSASISPTNSGSFVNGIWTGNMTVKELGTNFMLLANDENGHMGYSDAFGVYATNDMAVTLGVSPTVPTVGTNIIYTVTVLNPGPNSSTGVLVTNILPIGATYVSAIASQGTCTQASGVVTASLGTIPSLSSATVTITVLPTVAGLPLTNSIIVTRNEPDPNLSDNSAVSVVIPSIALTVQIANAVSYSATPWLSGGNALWGVDSNVVYLGTNAAQSGSIVDGQQSWLQTTVYGPGTLSFWWSVSSQAGSDLLSFLTNGVVVTNISGSVGWQQVTWPLPPGHTTLEWEYAKNDNISSGADAGWLDDVIYNRTPFTLNAPGVSNGTNFVFTLNGTIGQILVLQSSTNLFQWVPLVTNTMTSSTLNFTNSTTNFPNKFYRGMDITP
jgi:uncharacterized repeat protein (TIGR01451 family)